MTCFSVPVSQAAVFWLLHRDGELVSRFERGFADDPAGHPAGDHRADEITERIVAAYRLAKRSQANSPPEYAVGPMWEGMIRRNFREVLAALGDGDLKRLAGILEAFHRSPCSLWAGGSYEDLVAWRRNKWYKYQFINTWLQYCAVLETVGGDDSRLTYSQVGLPVGLDTGGGIVPLEAIRYHYWQRYISRLLGRLKRSVVCEIGGGLGGQAFKVLEEHEGPLTYVVFDIPETLLISSYFLLRSLPKARTLLYGEARLDAAAFEHYDLILMPNFAIPALPDDVVDLFFNSCSFSEMLRETVEAYVRTIDRCCRGWFLHVNHTARFHWDVNGSRFTNLPADHVIPDPDRFELVEKAPRPFGRIEDRAFLKRHQARHNVYLFKRVGSLGAADAHVEPGTGPI